MPLRDPNSLPSRVILASTQPTWGGGEACLLALAEGLRARQFDVQIIARNGGVLAGRATSDGFVVHTIRGRGLRPKDLLKIHGLLDRNIRTVLHCNDTHAFRCVSLAASGRSNTRIVTMRHTMFPVRSPWRYRMLADRVICVSNPIADMCRAAGIPADMLNVVHAGIAPPVCDPADVAKLRRELLPDQNHQLIVAVGNLLACKGHATLVEATARLKQQGVLVRTVISGEGDQREPLEALIKKLDVESEVQLLGFRSDANDLIAAADVFANPSHEEGLCLVVATAMMLGRPIVTTAVGGLVDVLGIDGQNKTDRGANSSSHRKPLATIAAPKDVQQWAKKLAHQLTQLPDEQQFEAARSHAIAKFTLDPMTDGTVAVYRQLWAGKALTAA